MQKLKPEIIGVLYRDEGGNLCVINDAGSYDLMLDSAGEEQDGMPRPALSWTTLPMLNVDWGNKCEYWPHDMWEDLLLDMKDDGKDQTELEELKENHKDRVFNALLLG